MVIFHSFLYVYQRVIHFMLTWLSSAHSLSSRTICSAPVRHDYTVLRHLKATRTTPSRPGDVPRNHKIDSTPGVQTSWTCSHQNVRVFPQQCKLMGSSAQNNSGVRWCRRRVRFNKVPEKVPKVPEKVWEASVQSQVRFNRVPERFRRRFQEARLSSIGFRRRFRRQKVPGGFGA